MKKMYFLVLLLIASVCADRYILLSDKYPISGDYEADLHSFIFSNSLTQITISEADLIFVKTTIVSLPFVITSENRNFRNKELYIDYLNSKIAKLEWEKAWLDEYVKKYGYVPHTLFPLAGKIKFYMNDTRVAVKFLSPKIRHIEITPIKNKLGFRDSFLTQEINIADRSIEKLPNAILVCSGDEFLGVVPVQKDRAFTEHNFKLHSTNVVRNLSPHFLTENMESIDLTDWWLLVIHSTTYSGGSDIVEKVLK